jgi:hypothetical protein
MDALDSLVDFARFLNDPALSATPTSKGKIQYNITQNLCKSRSLQLTQELRLQHDAMFAMTPALRPELIRQQRRMTPHRLHTQVTNTTQQPVVYWRVIPPI